MSLEELLRGNFDSWHGLSGNETLPELTRALQPIQRMQDAVERTRLSKRFQVFVFERRTSPTPIEAWFLYGQREVTLLEYDDPPVQDLEGTLQRLGPPEAVLENKRFVLGAMVKEYVYASRGITLAVGEPIPGLDIPGALKESRKAVHVQLYPPISTGEYITLIGSEPELRMYPSSSSPAM